MASAEERMQILKMIEEGKITAAEGAELLRALDRDSQNPKAEPLKGASAPRWFRVRITDTNSGKTKVNVNIPMSLVQVGIKMGARFAPGVETEQMEMIAEALKAGQMGKIVEVDDEESGEHVEIFVE